MNIHCSKHVSQGVSRRRAHAMLLSVLIGVVAAACSGPLDLQSRHIAVLFNDDHYASQYTYIGMMTGLASPSKSVLRLGYFMNYNEYAMTKSDRKLLAEIISENLSAAGMRSLSDEFKKLPAATNTFSKNLDREDYQRFTGRLVEGLGTNMYLYRVGDALWHVSYAAQRRERLAPEYEMLLTEKNDKSLTNIISMYRGFLLGTNTRLEVKVLVRGYVAD